MEPELVTCRDCTKFIADKVGDGTGIGECQAYTEYKTKNPGQTALRRALLALGNRPDYELFWGASGKRECAKFEGLSG